MPFDAYPLKRLAILAACTPLLFSERVQPPARFVTAVQHRHHGDLTRVAVAVTAAFRFRSYQLHNPERLYFDILDARPQIASGRRYSEIVDDSLLKQVRVAETTGGITRIVLALGENVRTTVSQQIDPPRLIIDLAVGDIDAAAGSQPQSPPVLEPFSLPVRPRPLAPLELGHAATAPQVRTVPPATPMAGVTPAPAGAALSARLAPNEQAPVARALALKVKKVVIDPGHGGRDEGTVGPNGLKEKDLVLDVALRLGKLIEERLGVRVIYTRSDDTFVSLEQRTEIANQTSGDLFLSIHANSSPAAAQVSGVETYFLNFSESRNALELAARENAGSQKSVFELQDLIQKITLQDKAEESREFAARVQASLYALSARNFPALKNRGVRQAPFVVLIGTTMPSVLAEIGFLSNPNEESLLRELDYRQNVAEALYRGIASYVR